MKQVKHITFGEIILGILGIVFILAGYYLSTRFVELLDDIVLPFIILFLTASELISFSEVQCLYIKNN